MRRSTKYLVLTEFLVLLAVPGGLWLLGRDSVPIENRARVEAPDLSAGKLLDEDTYAQLDAYFTDRLPLRDRAVEVGAWIDYRLFRDSPSDQVVVGRGDWLFFHHELNLPCQSPLTAADVVTRVDVLDRLTRATGRDFRFLIAPDKASIYRDRLARVLPDQQCNLDKNDALRAAMHDLAIPVVPLWDELSDARTDGLVFDPRGTHWTDHGRLVVTRALVESLAGGAWFDDDVQSRGPVDSRDELGALIGLPSSTQLDGFTVARPGVRVRTDARPAERADIPYDRTTATSEDRPLIRPSVAMLRDSQFGLMQDRFLAPFFAEAHFPHWQTLSQPEFADSLHASPVFVIQTVEREVWRRLGGSLFDRILTRLVLEAPRTTLAIDAARVRGAAGSDDEWIVDGSGASLPLRGPALDDDRIVFVATRGGAQVRLLDAQGTAIDPPWADRAPPDSPSRTYVWVPRGVALDDLVLDVRGGGAVGAPVGVTLPTSRLPTSDTDTAGGTSS
ncbi:MAG TPA: hypothetical protein VFZ83_16015 [Acidimicrobiia bacterium]|nr:hypothetical protein [Acidimicrobiia bacterium]